MNKSLKIVILALAVLITGVVGLILYRMFWQFDHAEVQVYVRDEANKYVDKASVYTIIMEGVQYILASHSLTQQVLRSARATGTDPEQELVHAAINQCVAFKYLPSA